MSDIIQGVVVHEDLAKLTNEERTVYYRAVCESLGLNPLTKPFAYIRLNNKLTLYARRDAADQLRRIHDVSIQITARERHDDVYVVTARATTPEGRQDESTGAVAIGNLKGDKLANAYMKAETKAKRRVTLSLIGLGWLDESEIGNIPEAEPVKVDTETGEIEQQSGATNLNNALIKGKHWIKYDNARAAFWAWTGEVGLSHDEVHEALELEHVEDYQFSMQAAKDRILAWIEMQTNEDDAAETEAGQEEMFPGGQEAPEEIPY